ncbi:hypothetical protein FH972_023603 [Carpinus fangiana]|uniref:USP domain-containing protein n=1 Tax=Carpinus fangiana TaxID=176857 RepID=A0A5N6KW57_9ROSI|nr:hypothetical protein FH972_023603 [Carpinus fangiana]
MSATASKFSRALSTKHHKKSRAQGVDLNGLFTLDNDAKKPSREEQKKINELSQYLSTTAQKNIPEARVEYVVRAKSTDGDFHKSFELIELFQSTVGGLLKNYKPEVKMLGAVNRDKVTCYLDALLFAMFAKTDVFEAILFNSFADEPRNRLVVIIRLWVNMLRTGRLITTDILRQQDVSEAFGFLTDQLNLPLLTLKTDIYHAGKEEADDDHKFITERLLDVAIPEEVQNEAIVTLETCLEDYFNNRVEVKRELQRRLTREAGLARVDSMDKTGAVHVETTEVDDLSSTPTTTESVPDNKTPTRPDFLRTRATSIFSQRRVYIGKEGDPDSSTASPDQPRGAPITKKEVSMPAWQFLNLIPWYTDTPNATDNERQAQAHFSSKRPMLGICLKRYKVSSNGNTTRLNTRVDVPLEMSTPYFAIDESGEASDTASDKFKLVLQAVVCHRGHSVNSGHYVSMVRLAGRVEPRQSSTARESVQDEDTWLMNDDLASERVYKVNIKDALKKESPYLLFYRVVTIAGDDSDSDGPPPYSESEESESIRLDHKVKPVESGRPSFEIEQQASRRGSLIPTDESQSRTSLSVSERRQSLAFLSDSRAPSIRPETIGTQPTTPGDEERKDLDEPSRTSSRSNNKTTTRTSTDGYNSKFFTKVTSRLSRDKLAGKDSPEIVINEVPLPQVDDAPVDLGKPSADEILTIRPKSKEKNKGMTGFMSRKGSVSERDGKHKAKKERALKKNKVPDRHMHFDGHKRRVIEGRLDAQRSHGVIGKSEFTMIAGGMRRRKLSSMAHDTRDKFFIAISCFPASLYNSQSEQRAPQVSNQSGSDHQPKRSLYTRPCMQIVARIAQPIDRAYICVKPANLHCNMEERNHALEIISPPDQHQHRRILADGRLQSWLKVVGGFFIFMNIWGLPISFGAFQSFYTLQYLPEQSSSAISWIGTIQGALLVIMGLVAGPIFDLGYYRLLVVTGSFLTVFGMMMLSLSTEYYQVFLSQGICVGLGCGLLYIPTLSLISSAFTDARAIAMGVVTSGIALGEHIGTSCWDGIIDAEQEVSSTPSSSWSSSHA